MSLTFGFIPQPPVAGGGSGNNVLVTNTHAAAQDVPVLVENTSIAVTQAITVPVASNTNYMQEAIASGVANVTLIPSTAPGPTPGNFTSFTALNGTDTDFTVQVGATNTSTITVRAGESLSVPIVASAITAHFTKVGQHLIVVQNNTSTT